MQRLFTTFPNGWPGAGLLLLRVACTCPVILDGFSALSGSSASDAVSIRLGGLLPATLLLLGLYTPVAALLQMLLEISLILVMPSLASLHLTRALISVALMGLGPGAWSVDARIYGRKRI